MTAEELEEEAKYHMDAEAAPSVAKAVRLAVDYADENNLAGVVVCGRLYLAAQARPLLLKEAEKLPQFQQTMRTAPCILGTYTSSRALFAAITKNESGGQPPWRKFVLFRRREHWRLT